MLRTGRVPILISFGAVQLYWAELGHRTKVGLAKLYHPLIVRFLLLHQSVTRNDKHYTSPQNDGVFMNIIIIQDNRL